MATTYLATCRRSGVNADGLEEASGELHEGFPKAWLHLDRPL